ncbi:YtxH domain-containing protein [Wenyingzhuangia sp. IMCC45467]
MSNNTNTALGILAGATVGAALGILFAPAKGSKTRKAIKEKVTETGETLVNEAESLRNSVADSISTKKETLEEQIEDMVSAGSHKAEDVITSLEKQLEILKKKNKTLQKS